MKSIIIFILISTNCLARVVPPSEDASRINQNEASTTILLAETSEIEGRPAQDNLKLFSIVNENEESQNLNDINQEVPEDDHSVSTPVENTYEVTTDIKTTELDILCVSEPGVTEKATESDNQNEAGQNTNEASQEVEDSSENGNSSIPQSKETLEENIDEIIQEQQDASAEEEKKKKKNSDELQKGRSQEEGGSREVVDIKIENDNDSQEDVQDENVSKVDSEKRTQKQRDSRENENNNDESQEVIAEQTLKSKSDGKDSRERKEKKKNHEGSRREDQESKENYKKQRPYKNKKESQENNESQEDDFVANQESEESGKTNDKLKWSKNKINRLRELVSKFQQYKSTKKSSEYEERNEKVDRDEFWKELLLAIN